MISRTMATLEWAAQVNPAARITSSTGWVDDGAEQQAQAGDVLVGRRAASSNWCKRHQHQAEADQHPAEIARCRRWPRRNISTPIRISAGATSAHVEGQDLDDQRGADVGAEHDGERRDQVDEAAGGEAGDHQAGGGAALQDGGDADARPARPGTGCAARRRVVAQPGAECALHAGLDHVDAPQQQGDGAGEVHQRDGQIHAPPLVASVRRYRGVQHAVRGA